MKKTNRRGFLLVEILVALSVVALVLGVLLQVFSHSLKNAANVKRYQLAAYLAEKKIWDNLWDDHLTAGESSGVFEDHPEMAWTTRITLLYHPQPDENEEAGRVTVVGNQQGARGKLPPTDLYQILVTVGWVDQGKSRQFELGTNTVVPVPEKEEGPSHGPI